MSQRVPPTMWESSSNAAWNHAFLGSGPMRFFSFQRPASGHQGIQFMRLTHLLLLTTALASPAFAATDYSCLNNCTARGMSYGYCQSACSYDNNPQQAQPTIGPNDGYLIPAQKIPQTDYNCLSNCSNAGSGYQYCKQACSY